MIQRDLEKRLPALHRYFPVISLTGPRQSGKTTLAQAAFGSLPYYNMEDADQRNLVATDPRAFLNNNKEGAVIDEAQRTPELFSYVQGHVDKNTKARFVLSGSQNFLLAQNISQSLAGRVIPVTLFPLSMAELKRSKNLPGELEHLLLQGFYPRLYDKGTPPHLFFSAYLQTYVERDVRMIKNIDNIETFHRFIRLCAGRAGQLLNMSALAADAGVAVNTAKAWLSLLEASYLIVLLRPYFVNVGKRLVKTPKLYFTDTGLLSHLLDIAEPLHIRSHYNRGGLFENFAIMELFKVFCNRHEQPRFWFWRDSNQREVDLLIQHAGGLLPVEIKSSQTFSPHFFDDIVSIGELRKINTRGGAVVYAGDKNLKLRQGIVLGWKSFHGELEQRLFGQGRTLVL